jgi:hypothetical protein
MTWDRRLYFPSEGSRAEKSDGFGRVWTRELGYEKPARNPQTTEAARPSCSTDLSYRTIICRAGELKCIQLNWLNSWFKLIQNTFVLLVVKL